MKNDWWSEMKKAFNAIAAGKTKKAESHIKKAKKTYKHAHNFKYYGGEAKCVKCGKYLQPDGRVTKKP